MGQAFPMAAQQRPRGLLRSLSHWFVELSGWYQAQATEREQASRRLTELVLQASP